VIHWTLVVPLMLTAFVFGAMWMRGTEIKQNDGDTN
jgi:hypothetical protein